MPKTQFTFSNALMLVSVFFTGLTFITPWIYTFGMNDSFYNYWVYHMWFIQMFSSQFLHGSIMHLVMNAIFILYFWNALERMIWTQKYALFFVLSSIFIGIWLTFLTNTNTVGISGFALAVLTYYTLQLRSLNHSEYTWWITAITINILFWLMPWISFFWHFLWMVFGGVFFIMTQKKK